MKSIAQRREGVAPDALIGTVLCHDVRDAGGKIVAHKGARLDPASAAAVIAAPWEEIHLLALDAGDLHEEQAGARLAATVVGDGTEVKGYSGGQWTVVATRRGLLRLDVEALAEVNAHAAISVFTLFHGQPVEAGEVVARAKVTPLVVAETTIQSVETTAQRARGITAVTPFRPLTVGVVARENLDDKQRTRFETALGQKIDWVGGTLLPVRYASGSASAIAAELRDLERAGAQLLIVAGASALDPLDPVFGALELLGARMERHGVPAHPGSLLWLAHWKTVTVVGMPTCGMFSQATTFDLVLPRLFAGERIENADLAALGHGGLISRDFAYRFPQYRANAVRGELE
jgi:hypothetical protein